MKYDNQLERTLVLVKPDGVERGLTGEILKRFERKGLKIVCAKMILATKEQAEEHYAEHKGGSLWTPMTESLTCGPLLAVVLEGEMAIKASRQLIGYASPIDQSPIGTIRADFAIEAPKNLVHGADSVHAANREILIWFDEDALLKQPETVAIPKKPKKKKLVAMPNLDMTQPQQIFPLTVAEKKKLAAQIKKQNEEIEASLLPEDKPTDITTAVQFIGGPPKPAITLTEDKPSASNLNKLIEDLPDWKGVVMNTPEPQIDFAVLIDEPEDDPFENLWEPDFNLSLDSEPVS